MSIQADRVHYPIATGELERRWKAIRAAMEERRSTFWSCRATMTSWAGM